MSTVVTCKVGEQQILIDLDTDEEQEGVRNHELWRTQSYTTKEPDTLEWIDTFFEDNDVIYDVGANIGQYALYAAKRLSKRTTVLAFEPEALNQAKLNRNIVLNDLVGIVIPYGLAIADRTAVDIFYSKAFAPGAALHTWGRPVTQGERPFPPQNQQGVMAVSIDDLTGRFSLPFPNHIKVDVDGIEEQVIEGARQTLEDPRLKSALVEVYIFKDIAERIKTIFFDKGFVLHNADVLDETPGTARNLIFTREP
ncbi:MAG: FkbM family methyltransferase [Candidatus Latescibacteria bacterium]|nr:FkbM family methyltransferase [Candidatus Latescibacterota bacterium]